MISSHIQLPNFLTQPDHDRLLAFTLGQEQNFTSTSTFTGAADYRKSLVLHTFPEFADLIEQKISMVLPQVWLSLGMLPFDVSSFEAQLTAHNDGNYYKTHNDNGSPDTATRELTYVYYFNALPKGFEGGGLLLYPDDKISQFIFPIDNSIVFFPSHYMHEVLPVQCESGKFGDSRFTINGWLRR